MGSRAPASTPPRCAPAPRRPRVGTCPATSTGRTRSTPWRRAAFSTPTSSSACVTDVWNDTPAQPTLTATRGQEVVRRSSSGARRRRATPGSASPASLYSPSLKGLERADLPHLLGVADRHHDHGAHQRPDLPLRVSFRNSGQLQRLVRRRVRSSRQRSRPCRWAPRFLTSPTPCLHPLRLVEELGQRRRGDEVHDAGPVLLLRPVAGLDQAARRTPPRTTTTTTPGSLWPHQVPGQGQCHQRHGHQRLVEGEQHHQVAVTRRRRAAHGRSIGSPGEQCRRVPSPAVPSSDRPRDRPPRVSGAARSSPPRPASSSSAAA